MDRTHRLACSDAAELDENVHDVADLLHVLLGGLEVALLDGVPDLVVETRGIVVRGADRRLRAERHGAREELVHAPGDVVLAAAAAQAPLVLVEVGIVELDAGEVLDLAVRRLEEGLHVEVHAAHRRVIVVERQLLSELERLVDVVDETLDRARTEEARRNDRGRVHADFLCVAREFLRVGERERADVRDEIELALRRLHPGVEHGLAFGDGAVDAFAGRARDVDARHLLLDEHLRLLRNHVIVHAAIVVERRVGSRNQSRQFLDLHIRALFV